MILLTSGNSTDEEYQSLIESKTWEHVDLPCDYKTNWMQDQMVEVMARLSLTGGKEVLNYVERLPMVHFHQKKKETSFRCFFLSESFWASLSA